MGDIELFEMLLRASTSFLVLLLLTRFLGRKQLSQLTFFNYITGITIGSIAANISSEPNTPFFNGLISLTWWCLLTFLLGYFGMKSSAFRTLIDGQPEIVIKKGKILENTLKRKHLNMDDLSMLLRQKNIFSMNEVETAVFEADGKLSVYVKPENHPVTKKDQKIITAKPKYIPTELVVDGKVIHKNLLEVGLTKEWLNHQLNRCALTLNEVFYVELQDDGTLYIDQRKDH